VTIAELGATEDPVLIVVDITDLKRGASTTAEITATDVKIDTFIQNQHLSKQRNKPSFL
jgi:hypothetical protein